MDILNVEEVIFNLTSAVSYIALIHLSCINKTYNFIANERIKNYDMNHIMKEFNIKTVLTHYKAILSNNIDIERFCYNKCTILIKSKFFSIICREGSLDELMTEFRRCLGSVTISPIKRIRSTVTFKMPNFTINQYNQLGVASDFNHMKKVIIDDHIFNISKYGAVQVFIKDFDEFWHCYKHLRLLIR